MCGAVGGGALWRGSLLTAVDDDLPVGRRTGLLRIRLCMPVAYRMDHGGHPDGRRDWLRLAQPGRQPASAEPGFSAVDQDHHCTADLFYAGGVHCRAFQPETGWAYGGECPELF